MARNLGPVEYSEEDTYSAYEATDTPSPGGSTSLEGLTDVDISNPTDGQTLVYDAASEKWVNGGSGGSQYATVTLYNISEEEGSVYELNQAFGLIINGIMNGNALVTPINNAIVKVPLAENGCFIPFEYFYGVDDDFTPVCTGGVALDPEYPGFLVTGDGTISAKGTQYGGDTLVH